MNKILVIAPHPDDETLGCGGALLKHIKAGDQVDWLIVTTMSKDDGYSLERIAKRDNEIQVVAQLYGFKQIHRMSYVAGHMDEVPMTSLVQSIGVIIKELQPQIVFLPNRCDIHTDHQIIFKASASCIKTFRYPSVKKVLMYETISETDFAPALPESVFTPNIFVDISDYYVKKMEIMNIYASEVMPAPAPRSIEAIEALAKLRGSRISKKYAEAFMLLEEIL